MSVNGLTLKQFRGMAYDTLWRRAELDEPKFHAFDWQKEWERGATVLEALDKYRGKPVKKSRPKFKTADTSGNRWRIYLVNDNARRVYISKGARKTSYSWGPEKRAKLFATKGEAMRYHSDFVAPYHRNYSMGVEPVAYGPTLSEAIDMKKNPKPFGKRRVPGRKVTAAKKPAPKFGRKIAKPSGAVQYVVRGLTQKGDWWYYAGDRFVSEKKRAAFFHDAKIAEKIMEAVEDRLPEAIKTLDVIQA